MLCGHCFPASVFCVPTGRLSYLTVSFSTFRGSEGNRNIIFCTNMAEVVCQGHHHMRVHIKYKCDFCSNYLDTVETQGHFQLEWKKICYILVCA